MQQSRKTLKRAHDSTPESCSTHRSSDALSVPKPLTRGGFPTALQLVQVQRALANQALAGRLGAGSIIDALLQLQRTVGNRSVLRLLKTEQLREGKASVDDRIAGTDPGVRIQRQPTKLGANPTLEELFANYNHTHGTPNGSSAAPAGTSGHVGPRTTDAPAKQLPTLLGLQEQVDLLKKQQAATALDVRWRAKFGERMASYKQAVFHISGGIEAANTGFQSAQVAQALTDQLTSQLMSLSAGFAPGFEWLFGAGLGQLGVSTRRVTEVIEKAGEFKEGIETIAKIGDVVETTGKIRAGSEAVGKPENAAAMPGDASVADTGSLAGSSSVSFLTSKSEALERQWQTIEKAFVTRSGTLAGLSAKDWETFDVGAQEAKYQALLNDLNTSASGVERLKPSKEVAIIIEKYLWVRWIRNEATRESGGRLWNFGTDIDLRLIAIGVEREAGVGLSEHWYQQSSDDWGYIIDRWALGYKESIVQ